MEGKNIESFFDIKDLERMQDCLMRNEAVKDMEVEMRLCSGGKRTCLISGSILSQVELVISVVDITERKRDHLSLEEANRKLNILSSITRHDTTNKLVILSGHLALHTETLEDIKEKKRVEMMSGIVDSLTEHLDFAESYRHLGIKSPEWQSVQEAGEGAAAHFDLPDVSITIDSGNLEVFADPMLRKVFYNLIDNSLKHGGEVTEIRITTAVNERDAVIIYQDDGVGISPEKKDKIFEAGYGRDHGLGLYLIREILKITNIDIKEKGTPGLGVRFELMVPLCAYRTVNNRDLDP